MFKKSRGRLEASEQHLAVEAKPAAAFPARCVQLMRTWLLEEREPGCSLDSAPGARRTAKAG